MEWPGVRIDVSHVPNWLNSDFDHIELRCDPVLPVTKSGYRSHFIDKRQIALIGGSEDFVTQRFDEQVKDRLAQATSSGPLTVPHRRDSLFGVAGPIAVNSTH